MTPLAQRIVRQLTLPLHKRTFDEGEGRPGTPQRIADAHHFECSAVLKLADDLLDGFDDGSGESLDWGAGVQVRLIKASEKVADRFQEFVHRTAFLPAPVTWIEYSDPDYDRRIGLLLTEGTYQPDWITVEAVTERGVEYVVSFPTKGEVRARPAIHSGDGRVTDSDTIVTSVILNRTVSLLALINTPRVIGRRQHMPHAGLQRDLARSRGMVGKYPLHAWSEIVLDVRDPQVADGEHEARLTGTKALHFCRAHLRVRNGQVEFVRGHWRGDPALGIIRSRYLAKGT